MWSLMTWANPYLVVACPLSCPLALACDFFTSSKQRPYAAYFVWHWLYACVCAARCNGTPLTPYMKLFRFYYTLPACKQWLFRTWKVTWDFIFGVTNMLKLLSKPFLFLGSCFEVLYVFIFWTSQNWNSAFSHFCSYVTSMSKEHQKTKNAIKSKTVLHA